MSTNRVREFARSLRAHGSRPSRSFGSAGGVGGQRGFTLIEVLVVVAIIALLIAILVPSLLAAKDAARCTKCLANARDMGTGMNTFATAHKDRFQVIGNVTSSMDLAAIEDTGRSIFAYESGTGKSIPNLLGWPLVLLREAGVKSLHQNLDWGVVAGVGAANVYANWGRIRKFSDILTCPADKWKINTFGTPSSTGIDATKDYIFGYLSYGINMDLVTVGTGGVWKDGSRGLPGEGGNPLGGRLGKAIRPSEVVALTDAGVADNNSYALPQPGAPTRFGTGGNSGQAPRGPFLEFVDTAFKAKFRADRHRGTLSHDKYGGGRLNITFVDGHGGLANRIRGNPLNPSGVEDSSGKYPLIPAWQYLPKARVSPYGVGRYPAPYP
ncbi:MAG: prepilin-type N-terminal cleavage/methylation domain-containing protein [Planctomycetes bacterium]|nr:prepilin-type N-terminal cleavage/methylation domain-containing protein [Planctomycetota bacterium]